MTTHISRGHVQMTTKMESRTLDVSKECSKIRTEIGLSKKSQVKRKKKKKDIPVS